ncbi:MAG: MarR family transcriptional regulator [Actinomycetia bacterium]|nr:MarR family transcriptional regulator [Actinomycetes bacterium]
MARPRQPSDADYRRLLELRTALRRFLKWSGDRAEAAGLTPAQHQLLLAVRGHPDPEPPTIGQLAEHLLLRHHSTVQLVDRAEAAGLLTRTRDDLDHRVVRVALTTAGEGVLASLAREHLEELRRIGRSFADL